MVKFLLILNWTLFSLLMLLFCGEKIIHIRETRNDEEKDEEEQVKHTTM